MLALIEDVVPDPKDPKTGIVLGSLQSIPPQNYFGSYVDSVIEALRLAGEMKAKPVSEWPKEYNQPVPPTGIGS